MRTGRCDATAVLCGVQELRDGGGGDSSGRDPFDRRLKASMPSGRVFRRDCAMMAATSFKEQTECAILDVRYRNSVEGLRRRPSPTAVDDFTDNKRSLDD